MEIEHKNQNNNNFDDIMDLFEIDYVYENKPIKRTFEEPNPEKKQSLLENLKQKIVNYPNHIKIDTDGNELEILKSMGEILKYKKLKSLCIENEFGKGESSRKKKIVKILKKNNFYLKKIDFLNIGYNMFFYRK